MFLFGNPAISVVQHCSTQVEKGPIIRAYKSIRYADGMIGMGLARNTLQITPSFEASDHQTKHCSGTFRHRKHCRVGAESGARNSMVGWLYTPTTWFGDPAKK